MLPAEDDEGLVVHLAGRGVGHQTAHEEGGMGANYELTYQELHGHLCFNITEKGI